MTTATDWDVTDTETGEHPIVTDVTSAATDAPVLTAEHALALEQANHQLSEQIVAMHTEWQRIAAENRRLQAELDRRGWLPTGEQMRDADQRDIRSADDLTEREYNAGLYRPSELDDTDRDGMPLHTIGSSDTWPTWLGDLHHADATVAEHITDLRSWAEDYTARPVERTVVESVQVDTSYRESEAWALADMVLAGRDHETGGVLAGPYSELAPERIQANESEPPKAITPAGESYAAVNSDGSTHNNGHDAVTTPPDDRVQRMTRRVQGRAAIAPGETETEHARTEPSQSERRKPWWRSEWAAAAGIVVGWVALIATVVVLA